MPLTKDSTYMDRFEYCFDDEENPALYDDQGLRHLPEDELYLGRMVVAIPGLGQEGQGGNDRLFEVKDVELGMVYLEEHPFTSGGSVISMICDLSKYKICDGTHLLHRLLKLDAGQSAQ